MKIVSSRDIETESSQIRVRMAKETERFLVKENSDCSENLRAYSPQERPVDTESSPLNSLKFIFI
jgi:hypothetical protein